MIGNILLVDDEPGALKLLRDILAASGHVVRPFNNGELALRSIMMDAPELILLDIRMPGMNGFEFCRRLKEDERLREIPIIFISAAADMEDKVKAFAEGGVDYITKPFQQEEVLARVKTHIALNHTLQKLRKMTEELRLREESLKMAQTIARLGHWEWDAESEQFTCSEEMCRILGLECPQSTVKKDVFLQAIHPDDRERVTNHLGEIESGNSFDIEYRIVLQSGEVRVVHGKSGAFSSVAVGKSKVIGTLQDFGEHEHTKMLGVIQDITEQRKLQDQLEELANTDSLTGCASRRHFLEHAGEEFIRVHRYQGEMSILMLDLDHFKKINDRHGHQAGDATLKKFVQVCQGQLRDVDLIGRLGGEEFAIMLPQTASARAVEVAGRLLQAVAAAEVPLADGTMLRFTTSIGAASLSADDPRIDTVINRADRALYQAKNKGRNKVCAG